MRQAVIVLATLLLSFGATKGGAQSTAKDRGEARLDRMLGDRIAGRPLNCVPTTNNSYPLIVIHHVGVVYDARDTIYVARVSNPEKLRRSDSLQFIRSSSKKLCTTDMFMTVDRATDLQTGTVQLAEFIPYTRMR